jgi:hypothetical protein
LEREDKTPQIEQFFKKGKKGEDSWRYSFFDDQSSAIEMANTLEATMHKIASKAGNATPEELSSPAMSILDATSWDWKSTDSRSRKRDFSTLAKVVVIELNRIKVFRTKLIKSSSAGSFRNLIRDALASVSRPTVRNKATHLEYNFPDGIIVSETPHKLSQKTFQERLSGINQRMQVDKDMADIRRVVKTVQGTYASSFNGIVRGPMEHNVSYALGKLVEVSS